MPYKYSIADMQKYAAKNGCKCLSEKYEGAHDKLLWECASGHQWRRSYTDSLHAKKWCAACYKDKKRQLKFERIKEYCIGKGGRCLSESYLNDGSKLEIQCSKGHHWFVDPSPLLSNRSWCPICNATRKKSLEDLKILAAKYGGKCMSEEYTKANLRYQWECKEGHQWDATVYEITKGKWCPKCANRKRGFPGKWNLTLIREYAVNKGGKMLSDEYFNTKTPLLWECGKGHQWTQNIHRVILVGGWCPDCSGRKKLTLQIMQDAAAKYGGKCLSTEYINGRTKMKYECAEGHTWMSIAFSVKKGVWCPTCSIAKRGLAIKNGRLRNKLKRAKDLLNTEN